MVLWIFGYGSLIWTPEFQYEECVPGYIKGYGRAFVRTKSDGAHIPGTARSASLEQALEAKEGAITGGVAYRVTADVEHRILSSHVKSGASTANPCNAMILEFFTPKDPETPAITEVMTYITAPEPSNLWYVVVQKLAPAKREKNLRRQDNGHVIVSSRNGNRTARQRASNF